MKGSDTTHRFAGEISISCSVQCQTKRDPTPHCSSGTTINNKNTKEG